MLNRIPLVTCELYLHDETPQSYLFSDLRLPQPGAVGAKICLYGDEAAGGAGAEMPGHNGRTDGGVKTPDRVGNRRISRVPLL